MKSENKLTTLVIAEAGVNHNGDMALARDLIDAAKESGADLVKFQSFKAEKLVTAGAPKARYQKLPGTQESQQDMLKKLELSEAQYSELVNYSKNKGVGIFSTAFDDESLDMLVNQGQSIFKVPSGEITNLPYLRRIGQLNKQILISTGMANLGEVEAALSVLIDAGTPRSSITVLHCSTEYPTQMSQVNLLAMTSMATAFDVKAGYSDHTRGIEVAIAAVALGASVIEKHFTMSRDLPGPDHESSLEPHELKAMVDAIRNIDVALGDSIKSPSDAEMENATVARKSLVAKRAIEMGELFDENNLTVKRPGTGVSPMRWDEFIGSAASRSFEKDELISR